MSTLLSCLSPSKRLPTCWARRGPFRTATPATAHVRSSGANPSLCTVSVIRRNAAVANNDTLACCLMRIYGVNAKHRGKDRWHGLGPRRAVRRELSWLQMRSTRSQSTNPGHLRARECRWTPATSRTPECDARPDPLREEDDPTSKGQRVEGPFIVLPRTSDFPASIASAPTRTVST
jgi:hypothetical protein